MTVALVLGTMVLLQIKHFAVDFLLQTRYQWENKGTYLHPGGLLHAGLHGLGTLMVCVFINPLYAILLAGLDAVLHYHIDWTKVNINKAAGWRPDTHAEFWDLLGADQMLHQLTYILLLAILFL